MNNIGKITLIFCVLWTNLAFSDIRAQFKRDPIFKTQYAEGRCGDNIKRLASMWAKSNKDLKGMSVIFIENRGISVFGMVNAERARGYRFDTPTVVEKNWYHHVIAVDRDGFVYDMDFMTKPYVLNFKRYIYYMFLDEKECKERVSGEFCGGAKSKMQGYRMDWYHAEEFLKNPSPKPYFTGNMMESLKRASYLGR
jgi:hypothetical protein